MFRQHDRLQSAAMGRGMHLWRYGSFGAPLLVFPSAAGMAHEWDAHGMVDALAPLIEGGKLKLYCTESNVSEAWTDKQADPRHRIERHKAFETYIVEELAPAIRRDCRTEGIPLAATGVSMGAYYATNVALKYPSTFRYALGMSGRYDATWLTEGFTNDDIYYNNPLAFTSNLDGEPLQQVRDNTFIALVCGQGPYEGGNIEDTRKMAAVLEAKGIPHVCDMWGHDSAHEWPWWRRQARLHLGHRFG